MSPPDLTAVKAMLFDAVHGFRDDPTGMAEFVVEWFAANQPNMGEKMLNMIRTDQNN
ncbi:hypothetical protein [Caulobacter sp. UC70_42]|uniref:hypothetical protein n=1 Tax=Caulobacter sp. UC70_42 TaxID=3374551 RepID=UPI0037562DEE